MAAKKIIVSGIQPTNQLTLGNYLGAIKNYVKLQHEYESYFFVADYHSLTNPFIPENLKNNRKEVVKYYLACGVDLHLSNLFYQSAIPEHLELTYLLLVHTSLGELSRMTQFKDKSESIKMKNQTTTVPTGLLIYPILMAADILMYNADLVPVGQDQKQHLELARNIALRINKKYQQKIFSIPEGYISKTASKIMDLQDPSKKMSKSAANDKGVIFLNDPPEIAVSKINKAKTDSFNCIKYDWENQPGVSNLIEIYCAIKSLEIPDYLDLMKNKSYGDLKKDVATAVKELLTQIQANYQKISDEGLDLVLEKTRIKCQKIAKEKVQLVQKILGLA